MESLEPSPITELDPAYSKTLVHEPHLLVCEHYGDKASGIHVADVEADGITKVEVMSKSEWQRREMWKGRSVQKTHFCYGREPGQRIRPAIEELIMLTDELNNRLSRC